MDLYVVRHAIAEAHGGGKPDGQRRLTPEGREKMARIAEGLGRLEIRLSRILSSPLVRARETAEILAPAVGAPEIEIVPAIASGASPAAFLAALRPFAGEPAVAVVGHEPDLGLFATALLGVTGERSVFPFRKGAVACFDLELLPRGAHCSLQWFLQPAQLRALAHGARR